MHSPPESPLLIVAGLLSPCIARRGSPLEIGIKDGLKPEAEQAGAQTRRVAGAAGE